VIDAFLSGATMLGSAAIGLIFLRSWRRSSERLFMLFGLAFFLLALERWVFLLVPVDSERRPWVYLVRLAAFATIIVGIIDKNRQRPPR
jgi:hypothetical protein